MIFTKVKILNYFKAIRALKEKGLYKSPNFIGGISKKDWMDNQRNWLEAEKDSGIEYYAVVFKGNKAPSLIPTFLIKDKKELDIYVKDEYID